MGFVPHAFIYMYAGHCLAAQLPLESVNDGIQCLIRYLIVDDK